MFIKSMKISNFQCFSEVPVDIDFEKDIMPGRGKFYNNFIRPYIRFQKASKENGL